MTPSITTQDRQVRLHFSGGVTEQHRMLASDLATTVDALRRTVELITLEAHSVETRNRDRIPADMRRQFGLYIFAPTAGSFHLEGLIGGPPELHDAEKGISQICGLFRDCWQALVEGDWLTLETLLPDRIRRQRWCDAAAKVPPRPGSGIALQLEIGTARWPLAAVPQRLAELRDRQTPATRESLINGYLAEIDFLDRTFSLRYPVDNRLVSGSYSEAVEDFLLANPRELIQVAGQVLYDAEGRPMRIVSAVAFDIIDSAPVLVTEILTSTGPRLALQPFEIPVSLDETEQYLVAVYPPLALDLSARTRQELTIMIEEDLEALWRNIVTADDTCLAPDARTLKEWLLARFGGDAHAA